MNVTFSITNFSGAGRPVAATGGNLAPSSNGLKFTIPAITATEPKGARRPQLRLIRGSG